MKFLRMYCFHFCHDLSFISTSFVNAHLTAHASKCHERIKDWNHIVRTLLFPPLSSPVPGLSPKTKQLTTMYATSHLFFAGDLNFRLDIPSDHVLRNAISESDRIPLLSPSSLSSSPPPGSPQSLSGRIINLVKTADGREYLKNLDELRIEREKGTVCQSLREPPFWTFNCTYKYKIGTIDVYKFVLFFLQLDSPILLISFLVAWNVYPPGQTESYTQRTPIAPKMVQKHPKSLHSYIHQSHPMSHRTTNQSSHY